MILFLIRNSSKHFEFTFALQRVIRIAFWMIRKRRLNGPNARSFGHPIVAAAVALTIVVLVPYFLPVKGHSKDYESWSAFGSYLGGTLGPLYAFFAFLLGLQSIRESRKQTRKDELLKVIQNYERDFEDVSSKPVTCDAPWVWGNELNAASEIREVSLRTLLYSDGIDWEHYLPSLSNGLRFRVLADGELVQDRDLWLRAHLAAEGIFSYLDLYREAGGDQSLAEYYISRYEIPYNRLKLQKWS